MDTPEEEVERIVREHRPVMKLDWEDLEKGLNSDLNEKQLEEKIHRIEHICNLAKASKISVVILNNLNINFNVK